MNREFFKRAVMPPLCLAVALAVILCVYFKLNIDRFIPLYNNTQYAYHDESVNEKERKAALEADEKAIYEEDKNADPSEFKKNQCIGIIRAGKGYPIRYDMDYSKIQTSVSYLSQSVPFGKTGFTYIYSGNSIAKVIAYEKNLAIGSVFGEKKYAFKEQKSFKSEYKALNYAPDCKSAVIIYYRDSKQAGFTSEYIALVYEEVE